MNLTEIMESIKSEKNRFRHLVAELKKSVSPSEKKKLSHLVLSGLEKDPLFIASEIIMAYWSMNDEVYTHEFIEKWSQFKTVILPSVDNDKLRLKVYKGKKHLVKGQKYNI